jgi:SH3-like domain-containing protein
LPNQLGRINVSVANIYREASYSSEIVNQGLLGELITVKIKEKNFSQIELLDGYEGWISNYQWVLESDLSLPEKVVRCHYTNVHKLADTNSESIRDVTIGSRVSISDEKDDWVEIILPDGINGWIVKDSLAKFPERSREGAAQLINEFLGYPYFWGGRSAKGFDCSGLIQTVFTGIGIHVPRDSWMQHRDGIYVADIPDKAEMGDLYFFSDSGTKITHVGMALGDMRIIHSRGMVRINSLNKNDSDYSEALYNTFVDAKTFF